jgi:hypothetical protein
MIVQSRSQPTEKTAANRRTQKIDRNIVCMTPSSGQCLGYWTCNTLRYYHHTRYAGRRSGHACPEPVEVAREQKIIAGMARFYNLSYFYAYRNFEKIWSTPCNT